MDFFEVGGAVRDAAMGRKSKDVDFVVVGPASFEAMLAGLERFGFRLAVSSPEYLTARGRFPGVGFADFVLARSDSGGNGRHPDSVSVGSLEEDLRRRDFTFNAMYRRLDPFSGERGPIVDPFGGMADLEAKVVRCVGDPVQRMAEDGLRALRAMRFAVRFGFSIEPRTREAVAAADLSRVSTDRIRDEMLKACQFDSRAALNLLLVEFPRLADQVFARGSLWFEPTMRAP